MAAGLLQFDHVSKRFHRGTHHDRLGEMLVSAARRLTGLPRRKASGESFWALEDVSIRTEPGQAVGVIGPNGAGKSTALKLMAGILRPDAGRVVTRGRVTALIEISAGFHGDLTGRENIYMNGAVLGMRRPEIERKLDSIIAFSGVEDFIDTPVKRYSAGMQARLGFSVAAHVDPDVLLVDEVLSVGDVLFRQRCIDRMRSLVENGAILIFVTHNLEQMQAFCSRAVVLNHGRAAFDGTTDEAVAHYLAAVREAGACPCVQSGATVDLSERIEDLAIRTRQGDPRTVARCDEPLEIELTYRLTRPYRQLAVEIDVRRDLGNCLANFSSIRDGVTFDAAPGQHRAALTLPQLPLGGGQYLLKGVLRDGTSSKIVADSGYQWSLFIEDDAKPTGILALPHRWAHRETEPTDSPPTDNTGAPPAQSPPAQPPLTQPPPTGAAPETLAVADGRP